MLHVVLTYDWSLSDHSKLEKNYFGVTCDPDSKFWQSSDQTSGTQEHSSLQHPVVTTAFYDGFVKKWHLLPDFSKTTSLSNLLSDPPEKRLYIIGSII